MTGRRQTHFSHNKELVREAHDCANPQIALYLLEWCQEAEKRDLKLKFVYRKALRSIIESTTVFGVSNIAQLEKLNGIGPRIRSMIENRLQDEGIIVFKGDTTEGAELSPSPEQFDASKVTINVNTIPRRKRTKKEYVPEYRSGPYGMLIALYLEQQHPSSKGYLFKSEIIESGQPYCNAAMDEGPFPPIQGAIKTLLSKELVIKSSVPARFSLTATGYILAERLWNTAERRSSALIAESAHHSYLGDTQTRSELGNRFEVFSMHPGEFDIILLVDSREKKSTSSRDYFVERLRGAGVACEQRSLELGDFIWIARGKTNHSFPDEIVLDHLIERKVETDLMQSITDGRFQEQKFRLCRCGLKQRIYLIERCDGFACEGTARVRFDAAIMQTQVTDDLFLRYTMGMEETLRLLLALHGDILRKFGDKVLHGGIMNYPVQREPYLAFLNEQCSGTGDEYFQSYGCFTQLNHKSANLTVRDIFIKQLLCIRQVSTDKAIAIAERFPTLQSLYNHYRNLPSERERERYFKDWMTDDSHRKFGPILSKRIYLLVCGTRYI